MELYFTNYEDSPQVIENLRLYEQIIHQINILIGKQKYLQVTEGFSNFTLNFDTFLYSHTQLTYIFLSLFFVFSLVSFLNCPKL